MILKTQNYFELFGVTEEATDREIKLAYVKMLRQYPNETHPEEFQLISKAHEILSDPEKKEKYLREIKNDGMYQRLMDEAYEYYDNEKLPLAKLSLKELMKNGYDNDLDVLILYKNVCRDLQDYEEERRMIQRLESNFSHLTDVKKHLCYYYRRIEDYTKAIRYAKQLVELEPYDNEIFITLIDFEYNNDNLSEVFRLFTKRIKESPTLIQNFSVYDYALLFSTNNDHDTLVKLVIAKYKELAKTDKKAELLDRMVDSGANLSSDSYAFKFYTLLVEELNNREFSDIKEWTDRGKKMFVPDLIYYSLNKSHSTPSTPPPLSKPQPHTKKNHSHTTSAPKDNTDDSMTGSIVWAIIFGVIVAILSENFWAGVVTTVVWYFFAGCIKGLLSCLVIIGVVGAILVAFFS